MIRTPQGRWVRPSPAVQENIERRSVSLKQGIKQAEILETLVGHPGWLCAQEMIQSRIRNVESDLKNFKKNDNRTNDLLMQEKECLLWLHDLVDDMVGSVGGFRQELATCEKELESRRAATND